MQQIETRAVRGTRGGSDAKEEKRDGGVVRREFSKLNSALNSFYGRDLNNYWEERPSAAEEEEARNVRELENTLTLDDLHPDSMADVDIEGGGVGVL
eukprot:2334419-Rhodomonas_salina.1